MSSVVMSRSLWMVSLAALIGCGQQGVGNRGGGSGSGAPGGGGDVGPGSNPRDRDLGDMAGGDDPSGGDAEGPAGDGEPKDGEASDTVAGPHGAPCDVSGDCEGGTCLSLPGGYCTSLGCAVDAECGDGAICIEVDSSGLRGCLAACDRSATCRAGYLCSPDGVCLPGEGDGAGAGDGDGGGEGPGDNVGTGGPVGAPCAVDAECAGPDANRLCLAQGDGFPGGYCTLFDCRPGSCPDGSACFQVYEDGGTACLDDCSAGCRAGYECRGGRACMPVVDGGPGDVDPPDGDPGAGAGDAGDGFGAPIGGACVEPADCAMAGAICASEEQGFPGGYCSFLECAGGDCPAGSDCFQIAEDGTTACLATCDGGCRPGYECAEGLACMPINDEGGGDVDPGDGGAVGEACDADADCVDAGAVCMTPAQGFDGGYCTLFNCGAAGCPAQSGCYQVTDDGTTMCLSECDGGCREGYACAQGLACMPVGDGGGGAPECQGDADCAGAEECVNGRCIVPVGGVPDGPGPDCAAGRGAVERWRCEGGEGVCGQIVPFAPDEGPGWWDYPLNGETDADQYRSYARRDVMQLVKYATSMVDCQSADWDFGNLEPLGLGDMSEQNGAIPGSRDGDPGHPQGTHVDGHDMDIAYFQVGTPDNRLRAVCDHQTGGRDAFHCTADPHLLDPWRTALFIAHLHESPQLRVIGVDGRIGVTVEAAVQQLCAEGYIDAANPACRGRLALAFEVEDEGRGWYRFHHHHLHISLLAQGQMLSVANPETVAGPNACITLDCSRPVWAVNASLEIP